MINYICNFILTVFALVATPAVLVWAFVKATDLPDVVFSYSTKECVRVEYPDGKRGDCGHLPAKFNFIWGE